MGSSVTKVTILPHQWWSERKSLFPSHLHEMNHLGKRNEEKRLNFAPMIIAVDFDGTIVEHKYPAIGDEIPGAVETLRQLIRDGHRLILWSVREGALLDDAVRWCEERGITFYSINKDFPEEREEDRHFSRKLKADLFIDDRNLGGLPDWQVIYQMVASGHPHHPLHVTTVIDTEQAEMMKRYKKSRHRGRFF